MTRSWKEGVLTTFERGYEDANIGQCSETIIINAPREKVGSLGEIWK